MKWIVKILRLYWKNRKITIPATVEAIQWVYKRRLWIKKKWHGILKQKRKRNTKPGEGTKNHPVEVESNKTSIN